MPAKPPNTGETGGCRFSPRCGMEVKLEGSAPGSGLRGRFVLARRQQGWPEKAAAGLPAVQRGSAPEALPRPPGLSAENENPAAMSTKRRGHHLPDKEYDDDTKPPPGRLFSRGFGEGGGLRLGLAGAVAGAGGGGGDVASRAGGTGGGGGAFSIPGDGGRQGARRAMLAGWRMRSKTPVRFSFPKPWTMLSCGGPVRRPGTMQ